MAERRVEKVTNPAQRVTDAQVLAHLARRGMDPDYVEFAEDYSAKRRNVKLYRDRVTGRGVAVVQAEPRVLPDGRKIDLTWQRIGNGRWQAGVNGYSASVSARRVLVTIPDQGQMSWDPVVTLDGKQIECKAAVLRPSADGYADVALEWDYGICRRRLQNKRTGIKEFWCFDADPGGEVVIDPRSDGDLTPDDYFCHDADGYPVEGFTADAAGVKTVRFPEGARFPCVADDSYTFYSTYQSIYGAKAEPWADARSASSGVGISSTGTARQVVTSSNLSFMWTRMFLCFDTSALPDNAVIISASFALNNVSVIHRDQDHMTGYLYGGMPNYPHVPLELGDFGLSHYASGYGSIEFTGLEWDDYYGYGLYKGTFGGWTTGVLTEEGVTSINREGYTKWALLTELDHFNQTKSYMSGRTNEWKILTVSDPRLVVEYSVPIVPTVVTNDETDVYATQATINGTVTYDAGLAIDERGFDYWDYEAGEAKTLWTETGEDFGPGAFSHLYDGLSPNTLYSVRAKAHNSLGWAYGEWNDIFTGANAPTVTTVAAADVQRYSAILRGTIDDLGFCLQCDERGFEWRKYEEGGSWHSWTESGDYGTGAFQYTPSLEPKTVYEFRAKARNIVGWGYGETLQFETLAPPPFPPSVTTQDATDIDEDSATGHGTIVDTGGEGILCTARGFEWGTATGVYGHTVSDSGEFGTGAFSQAMTGLPSGTTIYYRAFATNAGGTGYGEERTFETYTLKSVDAGNWGMQLSAESAVKQLITEKVVDRTGAAWLGCWGRRKQFTVTGSTDGALTDYQVQLTVYKGSGSDSGSSVYLDGNCEDDFADLRFTADDGVTELAYWRKSYTSGTSAVIWLKLPSIPESPDTVNCYIYYGNPLAESASDPDSALVFYDDFSSGNLDKWTGTKTNWSVVSGKARCAGNSSNQFLVSVSTPVTDFYAEAYMTFSSDKDHGGIIRGRGCNFQLFPPANQLSLYLPEGEKKVSMTIGASTYKVALRWAGTNVKTYVGDVQKHNETSAASTSEAFRIAGCMRTGYYVEFDNIWVVKLTPAAPTISAWSAEDVGLGPWCMTLSSASATKQAVTLKSVDGGNWGIDWADTGLSLDISNVVEGWWLEVRDGSENLLCVPREAKLELELLVNEAHRLNVLIPADASCAEHLTEENEVWLRRAGTLVDKFVIVQRRDERRADGIWVSARCLQIIDYLADELVNGTYSATSETVETILTALLAYQVDSAITLDEVSAGLNHSLTLDLKWMSVLEAIQKVRDIVGGYLYVDTDRGLHLVESLGSDTGQQVRYRKNLNGITKDADYASRCTKLFVLGHGEGATQIDLEDLTVTAEEATESVDATYAYLTLGGLYSAYQGFTGDGDALPVHITVWQYPEVIDVTADWLQNTDQKLKALLASYDSGKTYKINYTHAAYLKYGAATRTVSRSVANKELESAAALIAWGRTIMAKIAPTPTTYTIDMVNLEEKLAFERLALGNTVHVIDEELGIETTAVVVRLYWPDFRRLHDVQVTLDNRAKDLTDWFQQLQGTEHAFNYYEQ